MVRTSGIVDTGRLSLRQRHDPVGKIARVDDLREALRPPWREDLAAARYAVGPVGEAIGRVIRTDDQSWPHDGAAILERRLHLALAQRFERTIRLAIHLLDRRIFQRADGV